MDKRDKVIIEGRTQAMEWMQKLSGKWRGQAKVTLGTMDHADACEEFADELDRHISDFANS